MDYWPYPKTEAPQLNEECRHCGTVVTSYNTEAIGRSHRGQSYAKFNCPTCHSHWGHLIKKDARNTLGYGEKGEERVHNTRAVQIKRLYSPFRALSALSDSIETRHRRIKSVERFKEAQRRRNRGSD